jgi:hypothetical protein
MLKRKQKIQQHLLANSKAGFRVDETLERKREISGIGKKERRRNFKKFAVVQRQKTVPNVWY